jgi:trans-L-3-hydroxyproline dehydratase
MITVKTIDSHAAGEPLRLVVEGFPSPRGATMLAKRDWLRKHADHLRRALMLEPRGHADMYGAILTEPVLPGSHAGVLFMHNDGYSTMCGHGILAVTTIALERGLVMPGGDGTAVVYDTPAGTVRATARRSPPRVDGVSYVGVPSFVLHAGLPVKIGSRLIRADVAFGGAFYAIVDCEAVGLPLDPEHLPQLRRTAMEIKAAVEAARTIAHPLEAGLHGIYGTIFTGQPHGAGADLRNVTVFANAQVDRSPCGTGTGAVMAVLDRMGLLGGGAFVHESLIGTRFIGRVAGRGLVGDYPAIVPEIEGSAWITGEHTFFVDDRDPLREGFLL